MAPQLVKFIVSFVHASVRVAARRIAHRTMYRNGPTIAHIESRLWRGERLEMIERTLWMEHAQMLFTGSDRWTV